MPYTTIILKDFNEWKEAVEPLENILKYKVTDQIDLKLLYRGLIVHDMEGSIVAACTIFKNEEMELDGLKTLCFGKLLCLNDQSAFNELVSLIKKISEGHGSYRMIGPMDGSTWNNYRISSGNVGYKYFLDLTHPNYYIDLFQNSELKILKRYFTYLDENIIEPVSSTLELKERYDANGIHVRSINLNNYEEELNKLYLLCNSAFEDNYLFSAITLEEFKSKYIPLKPYIDPNFVLVAENSLGEFSGFFFACHDHLNKEKKGLVVKTIVRSKSPESRGLGKYLSALITLECIKQNYDYILHAFMEEGNDNSIDLSTLFNGKEVKEYHLYEL